MRVDSWSWSFTNERNEYVEPHWGKTSWEVAPGVEITIGGSLSTQGCGDTEPLSQTKDPQSEGVDNWEAPTNKLRWTAWQHGAEATLQGKAGQLTFREQYHLPGTAVLAGTGRS